MTPTTLSARDALRQSLEMANDFVWIDVRSQIEFDKGALPLSTNIPILSNEHRHLVGIEYKEHGQQQAIELGNTLVRPVKDQICDSWETQLGEKKNALICCWRGGLRSQTAQQWLQERGFNIPRVEGGYKAIRGLLLESLKTMPNLLVISGPTGCQKTKLLRSLPLGKWVDLEALAHHRGSAFGSFFGIEQPAQSTFDNHLLWQMAPEKLLAIEDESRTIGRCALPIELYQHMATAPRYIVQMDIADRAKNIFAEYVSQAILDEKIDPQQIKDRFAKSLLSISKKIGGALYQDIDRSLSQAFENDALDCDRHTLWIKPLLENYYDKFYAYALEKKNDTIVFKGSSEECRHQILKVLERQDHDF